MRTKKLSFGSLKIPEAEIARHYRDEKYLVTAREVYQLFNSSNAGFYGLCVAKHDNSIAHIRRGHYEFLSGAGVNRILGAKVVLE